MCFACYLYLIFVLNNKTIILPNLAEYCLILFKVYMT